MQEEKQNFVGKVVIIGGDRRTRATGEGLRTMGCEVHTLGCDGEDRETMAAVLSDARAVILPTPAFVEDRFVFGTQPPLAAQTLFSMMDSRTAVYGGRISGAIWQLAGKTGVHLTDYMQLEEVQARNAIPSAEGAIYLAMQQLSITLAGARVAVLGHGRIGRALAQRLNALGAQVSVAVRRESERERVREAGYTPLWIEQGELTQPLNDYDVVFNTIPVRILGDKALESITPGTLLIELASAPGGWSPGSEALQRLQVIYAPGLPAKYAPDTAGKLIAQALYPLLCEGREGAP